MRSIRVFLTDVCNANCKNCLNQALRTSSTYMNKEKFKQLCSHFQDNNVLGIKIMGGEPTLHPDFSEFLQIAQSHFKKVSVFTNSINDQICKFKPRETDGISYNFRFHQHITPQKMLLDYPGYRSFEIVIDKHSDDKQIIHDVLAMSKRFEDRPIAMLTIDCTSRIFHDKELIVSKFENIYQQLVDNGMRVDIDHAMPFCFTYGTKIPIHSKGALCNPDCSGLIDANFNLHYCNQTHEILINLFENDQIIPFKIIENYIQMYYCHRQLKALKKICVNCMLYNTICNGGCYITKDINTSDDILMNTKFPVI